ncbi:hypothetical protein [Polaromonas sp. CG9_12]|nr:hypothetical protein [Polaromonas sp. CG9_12]
MAAPAITQPRFSISSCLRVKWHYISFEKPSRTGQSAAAMMLKGKALTG